MNYRSKLTTPSEGSDSERRRSAKLPPLTNRLRQILCCLLLEMDTKEIAEALYLSEHTVKNHCASLRRTFRKKKTKDVVAYIARNGLASELGFGEDGVFSGDTG